MSKTPAVSVPAPKFTACGRWCSIEVTLNKWTVCPTHDDKWVIRYINRDRFGGQFILSRSGFDPVAAWVHNIQPWDTQEEAIEAMKQDVKRILVLESQRY